MLEHISISNINLWNQCRYCWKLHYLDHIGLPDNQYQKRGREYHKEVDCYHTDKPYDAELIKAYTDRIAKTYRLESEKELMMSLGVSEVETLLPVKFVLDGVTEDGVCDLKVTSKRPAPSLQSDLYGAWYFMQTQQEPQFTFNWVNPKTQRLQNIGFKVTVKEMEDAIRYVNRTIADMTWAETNEFNYHHWNTNCRWYFTHHPQCIFA